MEQMIETANGIRIYCDGNPHLHGFSLCMYLRAGCLYEDEGSNGISHFYEHVAVRNLNHIMGGNLYKTLDKSGLTFNASTGPDCVQFEMLGASGHFPVAAELIARLFEPLSLPASDIYIERKRIKSEIREEDEESTLYRFHTKTVWAGTAASGSVLGSPCAIDRIGKRALARIRSRLLVSGNVFFYVTGACGEEDLRYLASCIERQSVLSGAEMHPRTPILPQSHGNRPETVHVKRGDETMLSLSFDLPAQGVDYAARTLLYDMLFSGENALFYQSLSERTGYIYSYFSTTEDMGGSGNMTVQFEVQPQNLLRAAEAAADAILSLREQADEGLELVRPSYVDNAGLLLDDASGYNWTRAYEGHYLSLPYRSMEERIEAFRGVSGEDIASLAERLFVRENLTVCVKGDPKRLPTKELRDLMFSCFPSRCKA